MRGITKRYPGVVANDNINLDDPARRDPRPARRERRGQDDADERPVRAGRARRGRDPARRQADQDRRPVRRDRPRHQHGPPALHARAGPDRRREHHPGRGGDAAPAASSTARDARRRITELADRFGFEIDPDAKVAHPVGRPAAACRDPQGALSRHAHPRPRRADGRADAAGDGGDLRPAAQARRERPQHHLHQPQALRSARDRRPDHGHPARPGRRRARAAGHDRGGPGRADGRPRGRADRRPR